MSSSGLFRSDDDLCDLVIGGFVMHRKMFARRDAGGFFAVQLSRLYDTVFTVTMYNKEFRKKHNLVEIREFCFLYVDILFQKKFELDLKLCKGRMHRVSLPSIFSNESM